MTAADDILNPAKLAAAVPDKIRMHLATMMVDESIKLDPVKLQSAANVMLMAYAARQAGLTQDEITRSVCAGMMVHDGADMMRKS